MALARVWRRTSCGGAPAPAAGHGASAQGHRQRGQVLLRGSFGSGLGLYVVSNIIKKLKGEFILQSMCEGHKMTSFEFRLPFRAPGISHSEGNETKQTELLSSIERQLKIHRFRQKLL